jgi:hypothetical protein
MALNGHTKVLNAARETQLEQAQEIAELRSEMQSGFTKINVSMDRISRLLQQVVDKD